MIWHMTSYWRTWSVTWSECMSRHAICHLRPSGICLLTDTPWWNDHMERPSMAGLLAVTLRLSSCLENSLRSSQMVWSHILHMVWIYSTYISEHDPWCTPPCHVNDCVSLAAWMVGYMCVCYIAVCHWQPMTWLAICVCVIWLCVIGCLDGWLYGADHMAGVVNGSVWGCE